MAPRSSQRTEQHLTGSGRSRRNFTLAHLLLVTELALVLFFSMRPAIDPDYGWHVTNGQHVFDGKIFGGHDIYSWTATNLWIAHEWATEAVMGFIHSQFGATVNSVIAALIGVTTYAIIVLRLRNKQIAWSTILIALPILFVGAMRSIGVRPLMLELLYLSIFVLAIDAYIAQQISRARATVIVFIFGVAWANTHGSFVLLPVVLSITAAELLISRERMWSDFAIGGVIAVVAALLNPWGFHIFGFATQSISSQPTLSYIDEWKRPILTEALAIPLLLQSALALIGMSREWRSRKSFVGVIRTIAFGYLAFSSGRHIMLLGIAAAEMIASGVQAVTALVQKPRELSNNNVDPRRGLVNVIASVVIAAMIARAGWLEISPSAQRRAIASHYPVGIPLAANIGASDRLFNEYRFGGFLIMNGILPVFIDGRSELYGDDQLRRYASIIHLENGWKETIRSLGITKVLMPKDSKLATELVRNGWVVNAQDSVGLLLRVPPQTR